MCKIVLKLEDSGRLGLKKLNVRAFEINIHFTQLEQNQVGDLYLKNLTSFVGAAN